METYCVTHKKTLQTKILVSEEPNKMDSCFYQIIMFTARKSQCLFKNQEASRLQLR